MISLNLRRDGKSPEPKSTQLWFYDLHPQLENFRDHVLRGLSQEKKQISPKFLYDKRGSELFDQVCKLEEYYPTRVEVSILKDHLNEIVELIGVDACLIEYGAGSITKVRILLNSLRNPLGYVPIDISKQHLLESTRTLENSYPNLKILPVYADFARPFEIPIEGSNKIAFFPGSTLGNFEPADALTFLQVVLKNIAPSGGFLIGVDLLKDERILNQAYNDSAGVTAEFNLNLLHRINRELHGDFDLESFRHRAFFNSTESRIEMHIESLKEQTVRVENISFHFKKNETIHTENSYKFTVEGFYDLAERAGLRPVRTWIDQNHLFSLHFLIPRD